MSNQQAVQWPQIPFEELYYEPSRNGLTRPKKVRGRGFKMVNMGELFAWDRILDDTPMDLVPMNNKEIEKFSLRYGDLLFARQSLVAEGAGKCSVYLGNNNATVTFESHLIRVRLDEVNADPLFYYYYFTSPRGKSKVQSLVFQVAAAGIRGSELATLEIDHPPLEYQERASYILASFDDLIENNTKRIKILEEMARLIYREWFVYYRFPGSEKVKMVDSGTELGEVPEGWEIVTLQDICSRITDGSHTSPSTVDNGFPMASVKDMHEWGLDLETCRMISEKDFQDLVRADCKPLKNDVLIAKDGSYLKHVFAIDIERDVVVLSSIAILRPNEKVNPHYLVQHLKDPVVKMRMKGYVSGVAIPRIVLKDFRKFAIILPPITLQKEWYEIVNPMIDQCWNLIARNALLRRIRDLLLPKLISGQLAVA